MTWVYQKTEPGLWTVGYYDPTGQWIHDIDCGSRDEAAGRVAWLNGAPPPQPTQEGVELQLRLPGGTWYEFRRFVPDSVEWRVATRVDLTQQMLDEVARGHAASWPSCATEPDQATDHAKMIADVQAEHATTWSSCATAHGGLQHTPASRQTVTDLGFCPQCGGSLNDHVETIGEGPHGEETHGYRCLIDELSDLINDLETCEPPVEPGWVTILKQVHQAYKEKLDHG